MTDFTQIFKEGLDEIIHEQRPLPSARHSAPPTPRRPVFNPNEDRSALDDDSTYEDIEPDIEPDVLGELDAEDAPEAMGNAIASRLESVMDELRDIVETAKETVEPRSMYGHAIKTAQKVHDIIALTLSKPLLEVEKT
jgi:hypothetical protein